MIYPWLYITSRLIFLGRCGSLIVHANIYYSVAGIPEVISVKFELISESSSVTPTFTLTCTSTGGPVTTVSWRMNGTILNDYTSQILLDSENATYNLVLTLTGRLVGEYECMVSNNKSSSSSGTLSVLGEWMEILPAYVLPVIWVSLSKPHTGFSHASRTALHCIAHACVYACFFDWQLTPFLALVTAFSWYVLTGQDPPRLVKVVVRVMSLCSTATCKIISYLTLYIRMRMRRLNTWLWDKL